MASVTRSSKKTKKTIRRVSKSPRRIPIEIEFQSKESAYSDPVDSTRTLSKVFY